MADLTGQRFGYLTVLERAENRGKRAFWKCQCDCGSITYKRTDYLTGNDAVSCGCRNLRDGGDLTGRRFGRLTVLKRAENQGKHIIWECRCDCGNLTYKRTDALKTQANIDCGCSEEDLTGKRFGKLTVIGKSNRFTKKGSRLWECLCDCGKTTYVRGYSLKDGGSTSCGCNQLEFCRTKLRKYQTYVDNTCIEFLRFIDKPTKANTSGIRGVSRRKDGRYEAYIGFQKRHIHLGKYARFEDAVAARKRGEEMVEDYLRAYRKETGKELRVETWFQKREYRPAAGGENALPFRGNVSGDERRTGNP